MTPSVIRLYSVIFKFIIETPNCVFCYFVSEVLSKQAKMSLLDTQKSQEGETRSQKLSKSSKMSLLDIQKSQEGET